MRMVSSTVLRSSMPEGSANPKPAAKLCADATKRRAASARYHGPMLRRLALCVLLAGCRATPTATAATARAPAVEELGSLRNARVALARTAERAPLTYFTRQLSEPQKRELERIAPHVRVIAGLSQEQAIARADEAQESQSAGVEHYLAIKELADSDRIVLTNMRGVHGPAIADHVFAMLLALTRDLPAHLAGRAQGKWNPDGSGVLKPIALKGRTLLVVGLGGVGSEIARRGHGFEMRVIATRRGDDPAPDFVERVGKPQELTAMLPSADVVAIAVPLTAETTHLFDRAAFAAMKPGSYLVNIARGKVVDTDALVAALTSGKLAGACLDVTDPEPLPPGHPLWKLANVVITPHVASDAELTDDRRFALFAENLRRFDAGEPLLNVVDKRAGY
ncbi:MAG: D-2-hydroxyacid dehydrogenase [Deltaproteobacteria bacterium]|nr:MAG: D-2-hydroxyacid dehydrogenase [Deltaproteobacteria bacterium]